LVFLPMISIMPEMLPSSKAIMLNVRKGSDYLYTRVYTRPICARSHDLVYLAKEKKNLFGAGITLVFWAKFYFVKALRSSETKT
jgi:hypothetical protein